MHFSKCIYAFIVAIVIFLTSFDYAFAIALKPRPLPKAKDFCKLLLTPHTVFLLKRNNANYLELARLLIEYCLEKIIDTTLRHRNNTALAPYQIETLIRDTLGALKTSPVVLVLIQSNDIAIQARLIDKEKKIKSLGIDIQDFDYFFKYPLRAQGDLILALSGITWPVTNTTDLAQAAEQIRKDYLLRNDYWSLLNSTDRQKEPSLEEFRGRVQSATSKGALDFLQELIFEQEWIRKEKAKRIDAKNNTELDSPAYFVEFSVTVDTLIDSIEDGTEKLPPLKVFYELLIKYIDTVAHSAVLHAQKLIDALDEVTEHPQNLTVEKYNDLLLSEDYVMNFYVGSKRLCTFLISYWKQIHPSEQIPEKFPEFLDVLEKWIKIHRFVQIAYETVELYTLGLKGPALALVMALHEQIPLDDPQSFENFLDFLCWLKRRGN